MMQKKKRKRRIEQWTIDSLRPHQSQAGLFGDLNDVETEQLADNMKRNKQQVALEIVADGTIICGHQRVRAAKLLGWTEIRCWVRDDLEKAGDAAIEKRLIEDNMHRRQMTRLGIARCYLRLKSLETDGWHTNEDAEGDLRDHLAKRFGMSGRQLDRYAKMLDAPVAVQFALERNELTQSQVLGVTRLEADEQQAIADCIENGEPASDVVQPYMQRAEATAVSAETAVFQLVRAIEKAEQQLKHRFDDVPGMKLEPQIKKLASGQRFIRTLQLQITQAIEHEESGDAELNEFLDSVPE